MPTRKKFLLTGPFVALFGIWAAAPAHTPTSPCNTSASAPSGLDYVILASLADQTNVVGMAGYTNP